MTLIYEYTRKQAIEDGVLIDLTEWAAETGFRCSVAITRTAWIDCIEWPDEEDGTGQSERGRAHDVLFMAFVAVKQAGPTTTRIEVPLYRVPQGETEAKSTKLEMVAGPGDTGELVITIMQPGED